MARKVENRDEKGCNLLRAPPFSGENAFRAAHLPFKPGLPGLNMMEQPGLPGLNVMKQPGSAGLDIVANG